MSNTLGENVVHDIVRNVRDTIRFDIDDFFYYNIDKEIRYKTGNKLANAVELIIVNSIMVNIYDIVEPPFPPQTKSTVKSQIINQCSN